MQIIQVIFLMVVPYLLLRLSFVSKKMNLVSPILLAYLIGIVLGNINFIPIDKKLTFSISEIMVPLAIPLILFATDFSQWLRLARQTVTSFLFVILGAMVSATVAAFIFKDLVAEHWKLSGMLIGVYTGGTPNLMAVGMGLKVSEETLILANTSDAILGGIYFLFLLTAAKWLYGKFLPPFISPSGIAPQSDTTPMKPHMTGLVIAVGLAVLFVGISVGLSLMVTGKIDVCIVMLVITTLGVAASFVKKIRSIPGTYDTGQYFILVFSLAIGTNIDINQVLSAGSVVFLYTSFVMISAIIIQLFLATLLRIDVDTTIITSTAGIFGPAFIGPVVDTLKNREVLLPGLTCGLVGYAVGNYLGFGLAWLLHALII